MKGGHRFGLTYKIISQKSTARRGSQGTNNVDMIHCGVDSGGIYPFLPVKEYTNKHLFSSALFWSGIV